MAQDPAVFLGLDAARNRKARPNEHLARQFLDRYGVGQENYDQQDIRDVARAFTGWTVLRNQLRFFERERDDGQKTILGERGNWNSADAVRIIVRQRATAISLSRALFRWLVSETDDPGTDLLRPLVEKLSSGGDIGEVVETILRSNLFYSPAAYRQRVKSPVEFAVGMIRGLEANVATKPLGDDLARLGQNLYHPPTIRGWAGGRHWINAAAMAGRENLVTALLVPSGRYAAQVDVPALVREHGCTDVPSAGSFLLDLFLQGDVSDAPPDGLFQASGGAGFDRQVRSLAQWVVTRPEFQLA
jgi:uncharacterized protein (DUF1800 family)